MAEPIKDSGIKYSATLFILPARQKERILVNAPVEAESLFVPSAKGTGKPKAKSAGVEINPPPPTVESIKQAMKPATNKNATVYKFSSATNCSIKPL